MTALSAELVFDPADPELAARLSLVPAAHGVYAFVAGAKTTHLSSSRNLRRRLQRLLQPDRGFAVYLREQLARQGTAICCWPTGSALESALRVYQLARRAFPEDFLSRLRLRTPWFVNMVDDSFPRLTVTNRAAASTTFGPFLNREHAVRYEEAVLSLFQIRRCTEVLQPHPEHPGCIYGEMNLCLRPCQATVSADEYRTEANRVANFLHGDSLVALRQLTTARDRAAEQLDFEYAAELHRQREKLSLAVDARPTLGAELESLHGLAVTDAPADGDFWIRPLVAGWWCQPVLFSLSGEPTSLDGRLREASAQWNNAAREPGERSEHLAILARWFYSSSRTGEWVAVKQPGDYPIRKLSNALSRLAKASPARIR